MRLIDVSQLCLFGNARPSSQLLRALFESEIPVLWFSYGGRLSGIGTGLPSKHVQLRRSQFGAEDESGLAISRRIVEGKIRNERTLLRRNGRRPRFGRPALALDLAEEFRPLVAESVVVNLVNNKEIRPSHFVVRAGGVALTADGRRTVIAAYEGRLEAEIRHPTFKYRISYRHVLDVQARVLAACLLGEIPEYIAFTTR